MALPLVAMLTKQNKLSNVINAPLKSAVTLTRWLCAIYLFK
jgi:hypothetical protein